MIRPLAATALLALLAACAAPPPPAPPPPAPPPAPAPAAGDRRPPEVTQRFTPAQLAAIAAAGRPCFGPESAASGASVQLMAAYDVQGTVRTVHVDGEDLNRLPDTRFRAFAERAMAAVRNPRCARLPLPATEIGKPGRVAFRFRP